MANQNSDAGARSPQGQQGGASDSGRQQSQQNVHGEGNYAASRDYNERTKRFLDSGRVEQAARDAAPGSPEEAREMEAAEAEGKRHAKEEDPEITLPDDDDVAQDDVTTRTGEEE